MPSYYVVLLVMAAALPAWLAALRLPRLRNDLSGLRFWGALAGAASSLSLASLLHGKTGHAGTGFVTRFGWPKPFYFITLPEIGPPGEAWRLLYFVVNSAAYAAILLMLWTGYRAVRR